MRYNITAIFFCIDEFCKAYEEWEKHRLINTGRKRYKSCEMTLSEMLTIMVLFHVSPCKVFKYFYVFYLTHLHNKDFPKLLSYNRFVQLMPRLFVPLCVLLQSLFGEDRRPFKSGGSWEKSREKKIWLCSSSGGEFHFFLENERHCMNMVSTLMRKITII